MKHELPRFDRESMISMILVVTLLVAIVTLTALFADDCKTVTSFDGAAIAAEEN